MAAPALLSRVFAANSLVEEADLSIADLVGAVPMDLVGRLNIEAALQAPEICPVLTAVNKAEEIGEGETWHRAFERTAHISPLVRASPLRMGMQVYRELGVLRALSEARE